MTQPEVDVHAYMEKTRTRRAAGTPFRTDAISFFEGDDIGLRRTASAALERADIYTVEELAGKSRQGVAALRGIGPRTMAFLDVALSVEGLTWGEDG